MGAIERVFHAVLFEVLSVSLSIVLLMAFTDHQVGALSGTMIIIATIAMAWNFVFNWVFDKFFPGDKTQRTIAMRIFHVVLFEIGLLVLTIPVMALILGVKPLPSADHGYWRDGIYYSLCLRVQLHLRPYQGCYRKKASALICFADIDISFPDA